VRIMDTHPDLVRIGLIVTLLKWEAETLLLELQAGKQGPVWSRACIDENKWRARRHGLTAQWIDWSRDKVFGTPEHFERWWSRVAPRARDAAERTYWERHLADALIQRTFADVLRQQAHRHGDWHTTLQWMASLACDDAYLSQQVEA